jgi:hypothetical protein
MSMFLAVYYASSEAFIFSTLLHLKKVLTFEDVIFSI